MAFHTPGIRSHALAFAILLGLVALMDGSRLRADIPRASAAAGAQRTLPGARPAELSGPADGRLAVSASETLEAREGESPRRVVSLAPVRWRDADDKWRDLDARFQLSPSGGFATVSDSLQADFPAHADETFALRHEPGGPIMTWAGDSLELRPAGGPAFVLAARPHAVEGELGIDGVLRYADTWPGISERFRLEPGLMKHELVLERPPFAGPGDELLLSWTLHLDAALGRRGELPVSGAGGLDLESDGAGGFRVVDADGATTLWLPAPFLSADLEELALDAQQVPGLDAGRDPQNATGPAPLRLEWTARSFGDGGLRLELVLPVSELLARADRFPLVIDPTVVDMSSPEGVLVVFAAGRLDLLGDLRSVATGDLNGDGALDLAIGVQRGDGEEDSRIDAGEVHLLFGPLAPGQRDLATDKGDVLVVGADSFDTLGWSVAVGDLDGDGVDDLLVGAPFADGPLGNRSGAGEAHVLLGPFSTGELIDLAVRPGDAVFHGQRLAHGLGQAVAIADLTGDGIGDAIVTALRSDGPDGAREGAGAVHVFAGPFRRGPEERVVDLDVDVSDFSAHGESAGDQLGAAVAVGDLDGDGLADLAVSSLSARGRDDARPQSGEVQVFLSPLLPGRVVDLSTDLADARVFGARSGELLGHDLAIGDLSGDGVGDLVAGAHLADGPGAARDRAGTVAVVFGPLSPGTVRDLLSEPADVLVHGAGAGDLAGWSVAAGDLSGDGREDLVLSAVSADGPADSRSGCGELHAFFGPFESGLVLDLAVDAADLEVIGAQSSDQLGYSLQVADLTGDGVGDLAAAAKTARGPGETRLAAGEAVVVAGVATGCRSDADCDDGVDCTADSCDPSTGECFNDEAPCNEPPRCGTGPDRFSDCRELLLEDVRVEDPDGDALSYLWHSSDPRVLVEPPDGSVPAGDGPRRLPTTIAVLTEGTAACGRSAVLTLIVRDGRGGQSSCHVRVSFSDDVSPVLLGVPADLRVSCDAVPPPAEVLAGDACDPSPALSFEESRSDGDCPGRYRLTRTWRAVDACGNAAEARQVLDVVDETGPLVALSDERVRCLWPPNHRMVHFDRTDFAPEITDACSSGTSWRFVDCASSQAEDGPGDGSTEPDCVVDTGGEGFSVRAERAGTEGSPRRYAVSIVALDACGNASEATVIGTIGVSHDGGGLVGSGDCSEPSRR